MADSFTEYSGSSIFGRVGAAIKGVLFGVILIPVAIVLLSWNEGRAVKTASSLKEGAAEVVSVPADAVRPEYEGKLIHLSGEAITADTVTDPMFGVSANAIRLTRTDEAYQWKEEKKSTTQNNLGGGTQTQTTYTYTQTWADKPIPSDHFKVPAGHQNPVSMIAGPATTVADHVTMGAFLLPRGVIEKMSGDQPLALTGADLGKLPPELRAKATYLSDEFYFGGNPAAPAIGDQRVKFTILTPATFSIIARQSGQTLDPYPTRAGREIERVESGSVAADAMFQHAENENAILTWVLRLAGMLVMAIGIGLFFSPFATVASVIPLFGDILEAGNALAAIVLATVGSFVVIAVAWFAVRPVLAGVLIAAAIGVFVLGKVSAGKRTAQRISKAS
jgi:hypothetical protein